MTLLVPSVPQDAYVFDDCFKFLAKLPDCSVDSVVTDPPYHLKSNPASKGGFMGREWDGGDIAFRPEVWRECLRILKPGGHLLAFGGARTYHRMACAVEDAGFEIRDQIMWVYGSGFPKSMDVSRAIDKQGGVDMEHLKHRKALATEIRSKREEVGVSRTELASWFPQYRAVTANWERLDDGFRIPSEDAYNSLIARLGIADGWREMVRAEDLRRQTGCVAKDRRNDGTVYGLAHNGAEYEATTEGALGWLGWGTALKPAHEPIVVARKPFKGTVATNVIEHGTGALNIDACRVEHVTVGDGNLALNPHLRTHINGGNGGHIIAHEEERRVVTPNQLGRWPANFVHDGSDEVLEAFPDAPGQQAPVKGDEPSSSTKNAYGSRARVPFNKRQGEASAERRYTETGSTNFAALPGERRFDTGSAARFFYCAKASRKERNYGMEDPGPQHQHGSTLRKIETASKAGNIHPTVKPIALMSWLIQLVTPPGGQVVDPFAGSATTGIAALRNGFRFLGCENEAEYFAIGEQRFNAALTAREDEGALSMADNAAAPFGVDGVFYMLSLADLIEAKNFDPRGMFEHAKDDLKSLGVHLELSRFDTRAADVAFRLRNAAVERAKVMKLKEFSE